MAQPEEKIRYMCEFIVGREPGREYDVPLAEWNRKLASKRYDRDRIRPPTSKCPVKDCDIENKASVNSL